jgi:hypothetical protein
MVDAKHAHASVKDSIVVSTSAGRGEASRRNGHAERESQRGRKRRRANAVRFVRVTQTGLRRVGWLNP